MERKTCFFIGHRDAPAEPLTLILRAVEQHITEYGVSEFIEGHYGRFDALAARAVRGKKKQHPDVMLTLLIPYYPIRGWKELSEKYDATFYPPNMESVPKPFAIVRANEYLIRTSNYLISETPSPEEIAIHKDTVERLRKAVEKLTSDERILVKALFEDGLSERQYAKQLGLSQKAVNKRWHKTREKLGKS